MWTRVTSWVGASLVIGCAARPVQTDLRYDLDEARPAAVAAPREALPAPAPKRPPGVRTGQIRRADLLATLDAGPGPFLRQFDVTSQLVDERFAGWRLVQLSSPSPGLAAVDLLPNDVLVSVNGLPLARPDQFQRVWDGLRTAPELVCELWRGPERVELRFAIVDDAPSPPAAPAPPTPAS